MTPTLPYSIVIATYERAAALRNALASVAAQTRLPQAVIIVDASAGDESRAAAEAFQLPIVYCRAEQASAALQRNQGFREVKTPLLAFIDDDVVLAPEVFAKLCAVFEQRPDTAGVAARMNGATHPVPRGLLWWYYRLQAGFPHPHFGGRLFGPAINCFPCYEAATGELIPADWLNLGCVLFRTDRFGEELFPGFAGYSFGEDVHLSARMKRHGPLYFHASARYDHFPASSPAKANAFRSAQMSARHRRLIAREILGLAGWRLAGKDILHRLFVTLWLLRSRPPAWTRQIAGTWS